MRLADCTVSRSTRQAAMNIINGFKQLRQLQELKRQEGAIGYIFAWLLGIPIPLLLLVFLLRGCD
jgi:hypothetical protein